MLASFAAALPAWAQGIAPERLAALKAATALVLVESVDGPSSGTGFLIRRDAEGGLLATNAHVVEAPARTNRRVRVVFNAGVPGREQTVAAEVVGEDSSRDLAILRVRGALPEAISLARARPVNETMPVWVLGFPFGEELATNRLSPSITITTGSVSSLRLDDFGKVSLVQVDADINPGNSGGPVVDSDGNLVGIATEKIDATSVGLALPPSELEAMLRGRVQGADFRPVSNREGKVEWDADISLIDPLQQVRSASLLLLPQSALAKPGTSAQGAWEALPRAQVFPLAVANGRANGRVSAQSNGREDVPFWQQVRIETATGQSLFTQPARINAPFSQGFAGAVAAPNAGASTSRPATAAPAAAGGGWIGAAGGNKGAITGQAPAPVGVGRPLAAPAQDIEGVSVQSINLPAAALIPDLVWSADGASAFFLEKGGALHQVSVPAFQLVRTLNVGGGATDLAMSRQGLVVGLKSQVWVVDPATLEVKKRVSVPDTRGLTAAPASDIAFVASGEEELYAVNTAEGNIAQTYRASAFVAQERAGRFRQQRQVLNSWGLPTLSPDGKYLFVEDFHSLHRFSVNGAALTHEEEGPMIGQNPQRIEVSPDSAYLALLDGGGNMALDPRNDDGWRAYTTYLFPINSLSAPAGTVTSGAYPRTLAFDKVASRLYGHNREAPFIVFAPDGTREREVKLPVRGNAQVERIVAHPSGSKALVLTQSGLFWIVLPQ